MARKKTVKPTVDSPPRIDDFSLIEGIGPVFSGRLHDAGICTYRQLASFSPTKLAEKVSGLSAKQITRQNLISQARKLAPQKTASKHPPKEAPRRTIRQHYVNFTIEFLLDEKKVIRRTRVVHIQSGDADTWAGWESDQLTDFIARHTGVRAKAKRLDEPENSAICRKSIANSGDGFNSIEIKRRDPLHLLPNKREMVQPRTENTQSVLQSRTNTNFTSTLRVQDINVLRVGSDTPIYSLRQDQPYHIRLTLNPANAVLPRDIPLRYKVTIDFKKLGGASCIVAEESSTIILSDCKTLDIACTNPPPGLYRPDVFVILISDETAPGIMASLKGGLIQVY